MHNTDRCDRLQCRRVSQRAHAMHSYDFFNQLTGPDLLDVVDQQLPVHRERLFPPTATLSLFMAQSLNPDRSCQATMNRHAVERIANGLAPCSTATGAYCRARKRMPLAMIQPLVRHTGALLAGEASRAWQWRGRVVKLVDGSTVTMPDTAENQARYPQSRTQKPGLGFPIARAVALLCLGTGAVVDSALGPCAGKGSSENALLYQLLSSIAKGDVILGDRYYCSYFVIAMLLARGGYSGHVKPAFRAMGSQWRHTDFRCGQKIGRLDHVTTWIKPQQKPRWLSQEDFDAAPATLRVRETDVGTKILVTTLLSSTDARRSELKDLYHQRWNVELDLRNIKSVLGLDRLACKTPEMNEKQWWVGLLAYNLIRLLMIRSAQFADILPRHLSFKHSLQLWLAWSQRGLPPDEAQIEHLWALIAQQRVGRRPRRSEPRAVKRRPKPFPLLTQPRPAAREKVRLHGHPKRLK